jgi:hypothetical protein
MKIEIDAAIKAIQDVEELPGEMPHKMQELFLKHVHNKETLAGMLRMLVKDTKEEAIENIKKLEV